MTTEPTPGNETLEILYNRASLRSYLDRDIPQEVMQKIYKAGKHAATGGNLQPVSIIEIRDREIRKKLGEMCWQNFMADAPVHLLFCIDLRRLQRWAALNRAPFTATRSIRTFWISFQDVIICAQNICTAADAIGLGSVYIGTIMEYLKDLKVMFELPEGVLPVVLLCLGYPVKKPEISNKLDAQVFVHSEKYRELPDAELNDSYRRKYPRERFEMTEKTRRTFLEVCTRVVGPDKAGEWLRKAEENGGFNMAQRYYALHYRADLMCQNNAEFIGILRDYGFGCFDEQPGF
ncbi:nitroreductase family protein [bacterium]|nr:nitroreductase family protein [candidate division CSSED10-310 bacterium]